MDTQIENAIKAPVSETKRPGYNFHIVDVSPTHFIHKAVFGRPVQVEYIVFPKGTTIYDLNVAIRVKTLFEARQAAGIEVALKKPKKGKPGAKSPAAA